MLSKLCYLHINQHWTVWLSHSVKIAVNGLPTITQVPLPRYYRHFCSYSRGISARTLPLPRCRCSIESVVALCRARACPQQYGTIAQSTLTSCIDFHINRFIGECLSWVIYWSLCFRLLTACSATHEYIVTKSVGTWRPIIGVCNYYIGPIGDLSLLTATAARVHSLHWVIEIKFQKWCCCVLL